MALRGRSFQETDSLWFVTTTIVSYAKAFTDEKYFRCGIDNLKFYRQKYKFRLLGYVIMPEHVHFLLHTLQSTGRISDVMRDWKWSMALDIKKHCQEDKRSDLLELFQSNAQQSGREGFQVWMPRFDDVVIYSSEMFNIKLNYIHYNPVKRGLVENPEDWKYSSARNYLFGDHSVIEVDTNL